MPSTSNDFHKALNSANELHITFTGRKSGKKFSTPVWFVNDSTKIYLIPVNGTQTQWYKNILKNPDMDLQVSGKKVSSKANTTTEKERLNWTISEFVKKYGATDIKRYYPRKEVVVEIPI